MRTNTRGAMRAPLGEGRGRSGGAADLDEALREALAAGARDERDTVASLIADSFRGQSRPLALLTLAAQIGLVAGAAASAAAFFAADATRSQILYATLFLWAMMAAGMIKAWFWMQIHRNRVLREVKRLELQVAALADGVAARA